MIQAGVGTIIGHAQLEAVIASSTLSVVYRARDLRIDQPCAVRLLQTPFDHLSDIRQEFRHAVQIAASLHHDHILRIIESGEWRGHGYITSEYMAAGSIRSWLQRAKPSFIARLDLARQAALALAYSHRFNIAHGDLRPDALLLTPDARYRSGFRLVVGGFALGHLSSEAIAIGGLTPNVYLSPERRNGELPAPAADMFAFGRILVDIFGDRIGDPAVVNLINRCCASDPVDRPAAAVAALTLAMRIRALEARNGAQG